MLDRYSLNLLKPLVGTLATKVQRAGISANQITVAALAVGLLSAVCIANRLYITGLVLLLTSRLLDAIDGAVARLNQPSDLGAFLDITCDFLFYASIPLAFAWANPIANSLAAAALLAAFIGTGSSFLAYAIFAQKRGLSSAAYPTKGFYFLGGLTEGTETILAFCAMTIWPEWFASIAIIFAFLCCITIVTRIFNAIKMLR
jgi:phosphatidylglycerophosphate synthase